jgi:hypothetical protein
VQRKDRKRKRSAEEVRKQRKGRWRKEVIQRKCEDVVRKERKEEEQSSIMLKNKSRGRNGGTKGAE